MAANGQQGGSGAARNLGSNGHRLFPKRWIGRRSREGVSNPDQIARARFCRHCVPNRVWGRPWNTSTTECSDLQAGAERVPTRADTVQPLRGVKLI